MLTLNGQRLNSCVIDHIPLLTERRYFVAMETWTGERHKWPAGIVLATKEECLDWLRSVGVEGLEELEC